MSTPNFPVELTAAAIAQAWDVLSNGSDRSMRIFVQGGGCSGFNYGFSVDKEQGEDDFVQFYDMGNGHGFSVLVDSMSATLLQGATVDFEEQLMSRHFAVRNPNAQSTCGCGSSFSV